MPEQRLRSPRQHCVILGPLDVEGIMGVAMEQGVGRKMSQHVCMKVALTMSPQIGIWCEASTMVEKGLMVDVENITFHERGGRIYWHDGEEWWTKEIGIIFVAENELSKRQTRLGCFTSFG